MVLTFRLRHTQPDLSIAPWLVAQEELGPDYNQRKLCGLSNDKNLYIWASCESQKMSRTYGQLVPGRMRESYRWRFFLVHFPKGSEFIQSDVI